MIKVERRRREKLLGCDGELEYAFLFEPAQATLATFSFLHDVSLGEP